MLLQLDTGYLAPQTILPNYDSSYLYSIHDLAFKLPEEGQGDVAQAEAHRGKGSTNSGTWLDVQYDSVR